jgi:hypothetical protein
MIGCEGAESEQPEFRAFRPEPAAAAVLPAEARVEWRVELRPGGGSAEGAFLS